jgi:hypothetical protein
MEEPDGVAGPDCEDFGGGMSCAPVEWDYYGASIPLDFNAGFVGAVQDETTLQIRPAIGWFITERAAGKVEPAAGGRWNLNVNAKALALALELAEPRPAR